MSGPARGAAAARGGRGPAAQRAGVVLRPLSDAELDLLEALLERVPAPLEPLDACMLDGFLCGLLVQPGRVPEGRWLPFVSDIEGRALPAGYNAAALHALVRRRHAELNAAIEQRRWFDPWVFELEADLPIGQGSGAADEAGVDEADAPPEVQAVYPWVAGFVTALEQFPALMAMQGPALNDALVLLYRHLDPEDLEDADEIVEAIDSLEPPENLGVAVEELVRATLLLADIGRPVGAGSVSGAAKRPHRPAPKRR